MEELVKRVAEKAGISEEQARSAVSTVAEFLKEKVPPMYAGYIDKFMSGGGLGEGKSGIGSMFGF